MVHGYPDFGIPLSGFTIDTAELAARLGSINTYDRKGLTVWMEDFETTLQNVDWGSDGTGDVYWDNTYSRSGAYSAKLAFTEAADERIFLEKKFGSLPLGAIGFEASAYIEADCSPIVLRLDCPYAGSKYYGEMLWYLSGTKGIYIIDSAGNEVRVLTLSETQVDTSCWSTLKLVVDFNTGRYVRANVNRHSVPLSDYELPVQDSFIEKVLRTQLWVNKAAETARNTWIDDLILTNNEPGSPMVAVSGTGGEEW